MDCDTAGVEPDFALVKFKKLAGGGYFKIINASIPPALTRLGYTPSQVEEIVRYCRGAATLQGCPHVNLDSLKAKGFTSEVLHRVEAHLPSVFDLSFAFNRWILGDEFCKKQLGLTQEQLEMPGFDVLAALGTRIGPRCLCNPHLSMAEPHHDASDTVTKQWSLLRSDMIQFGI